MMEIIIWLKDSYLTCATWLVPYVIHTSKLTYFQHPVKLKTV